MSLLISSRVWAESAQSGDRLLVMLALADHCKDDGICWPSQASLAQRVRCSERGVQKIIDALILQGEIEMLTPGGGRDHKGRGISARYRLTRYLQDGANGIPPFMLDKDEPCSPLNQEEGRTPRQRRANATTKKGERHDKEGRTACSPESSLEPSLQSSLEPSLFPASPEKEVSERGVKFAEWFRTLLPAGMKLTAKWQRNWAKCYDDMIRIDKRTDAEIVAVCRWARGDVSFWQRNFLSPLKLRETKNGIQWFDAFTEKMKEPPRTNGQKPKVLDKGACAIPAAQRPRPIWNPMDGDLPQ